MHRAKRAMHRRFVCAAVIATALSFGVGFISGYFAFRLETEPKEHSAVVVVTADNLVALLNSSQIEENVRSFSSQPHLAGSKRQKELAEVIKATWTDYGFDVDMPEYDVLLTVPDKSNPDYIQVLNDNGTVLFNYTFVKQAKANPEENKTWTIPRYFFYSASGTFQAGLLYVNEGRREDFRQLKNLNITSCTGAIVILKQIFEPHFGPREQIENALECNATAVLVFSGPDPNETLGRTRENSYPKSTWLPEHSPLTHPLRSSIGDPLTPDLPAINGIYRLEESESDVAVQLPIQLVDYSVARELLSRLQGTRMPKEWKIKSDENTEYRLGPHLSENATIYLALNTKTTRQKVYNVIGTVHGWDEPDHWVLIGNHRDAVTFGAADAVSGSAAMMEISRGVSELLKKGWKPRRTIKFCSWAAEESGLIGSTEWVEEIVEVLRQRAVVYINIDWFVHGNYTLKSNGNPMLTDFIFSQTKLVKDPHRLNHTIYSTWTERTPSNRSAQLPQFYTSGRATDYQPFYEFAGVPSLDLQYAPKPRQRNLAYHTPYDTYHMTKMVDPNFKLHFAQSELTARLLFNMVHSPLLPFNLTHIFISLKRILTKTEHYYAITLKQHNITLDYIKEETRRLGEAISLFEKLKTSKKNTTREKQDRMLNKRMVILNKMFLAPASFRRNPSVRNLLYGISKHNFDPANGTLPAISDAIEDAKVSGSWSAVKRQLSVTNHCIIQARKLLMVTTELK